MGKLEVIILALGILRGIHQLVQIKKKSSDLLCFSSVEGSDVSLTVSTVGPETDLLL